VSNIQHQNGSGTVLANFTYSWDAASRLTQKTDNGAATTYAYDTTNQLTGAGTATYSYDLNGNRTMAHYQTGPGNELTNDGTWTYTYDNKGNLVQKSKGPSAETWTYGYDVLNHMVWAKDSQTPGGTVLSLATYVYDVFGNRIEKDTWTVQPGTTLTARFGYDGQTIWVDMDGSNTLQTRYVTGDVADQLFARVTSGAVSWFLTDYEGSVRNLTDSSGNVIDTIAYDAYGNITGESSSAAGGRRKYDGGEADSETGYTFFKERYYNPATGSWTEQDPIAFSAGDTNLYRYASNGPTDWTDPTGLDVRSNKRERFLRFMVEEAKAVMQGGMNFAAGGHPTPPTGWEPGNAFEGGTTGVLNYTGDTGAFECALDWFPGHGGDYTLDCGATICLIFYAAIKDFYRHCWRLPGEQKWRDFARQAVLAENRVLLGSDGLGTSSIVPIRLKKASPEPGVYARWEAQFQEKKWRRDEASIMLSGKATDLAKSVWFAPGFTQAGKPPTWAYLDNDLTSKGRDPVPIFLPFAGPAPAAAPRGWVHPTVSYFELDFEAMDKKAFKMTEATLSDKIEGYFESGR
jgi:RHS repeat-associated protein